MQRNEAREVDGQDELPSEGILRIYAASQHSQWGMHQDQADSRIISELSILEPTSLSHSFQYPLFVHTPNTYISQLPSCSAFVQQAAAAA